MAGGTWLSQNKKRPAAYINFKGVKKSSMTVGDRGIVAMGLPLSWGAEGSFIEVLSTDLLDGSSLKKIGFTAFDSESKLLVASLRYAYKALVYRMDTGGTKAKYESETLNAEAKYNGTFGNKIIIAVTRGEDGLFTVITYVDGDSKDSQKVSDASDLVANDYVTFSGSGEPQETAGVALTGGSNGEVVESSAYNALFKALRMAKWQVYACFATTASLKANVVQFINQLRDGEGRYVQAVVADYDASDDEGIINNVCGAVIDGVEYSKVDFVAITAGMTAGASFNESNTAKVISGATAIIGELTDEEIKEGLSKGQFIISTSTSGKIKVEQDINSLHTFTSEKGYDFSKNRILRTLDEIGTSTKITWEDTYMGKVNNDPVGRNLFKADLVSYGTEIQRLSGIQNFAGGDDVTVAQGNDADSVVVDWAVQPVDSMEKLYMTVNVG